MVFFRNLRSSHFCKYFRIQNTLPLVRIPLHSSPISLSSFPDSRKSASIANPFLFSSIFQRTLSASSQLKERDLTESTDSENDESSENVLKKIECVRKSESTIMEKKGRKRLDVMFKEAVGLSEKLEESESSEEEEPQEGKLSSDSRLKEIKELKKKLRKLEEEVRILKGNDKDTDEQKKTVKKDEGQSEVQSKPKRLYSLFANDNKSGKSESLREEKRPQKELSPEMVSLVSRFHEEGYLNNANFLPHKKLDFSRFSDNYPRDFLRFAAERFGKDHQEIATVAKYGPLLMLGAPVSVLSCSPFNFFLVLSLIAVTFHDWLCRWLSGGDLEKVVRFGCPSMEKSTVFAAKRLRKFFSIQEDTVCRACKLKSSCKFANQRVWKVNNLNFSDAMRVLILYALDSVSPQLVVPIEIKASISRLLKEVINLTQ